MDDSNLIVDFMPEARSVAFDLAWLFANRYDTAPPTCQRGDVDDQTLLWDSGLGDDLPQADFSAVMSDDAALYRWLGDVVHLMEAVVPTMHLCAATDLCASFALALPRLRGCDSRGAPRSSGMRR